MVLEHQWEGKQAIRSGWSLGRPSYMFTDPDAQSPFARLPEYGFRLARYTTPPPESALAPVQVNFRDFSREKAAPDEIFRAYRSLYAYDKRGRLMGSSLFTAEVAKIYLSRG